MKTVTMLSWQCCCMNRVSLYGYIKYCNIPLPLELILVKISNSLRKLSLLHTCCCCIVNEEINYSINCWKNFHFSMQKNKIKVKSKYSCLTYFSSTVWISKTYCQTTRWFLPKSWKKSIANYIKINERWKCFLIIKKIEQPLLVQKITSPKITSPKVQKLPVQKVQMMMLTTWLI